MKYCTEIAIVSTKLLQIKIRTTEITSQIPFKLMKTM